MAIPQLDQYDDLRKEVARRYEQLHPDVKAALVSVDTAGAVYEIGKKFGLNIEKTGYLADVIGYTIIGLLPVNDFVNNLKDIVEIDGAKAEEIAREVNSKIFFAIRARLKEMHGEKWDERAITQESGIRNKELGITETPTKPTPPVSAVPTAPKLPWEIRPDGFGREASIKEQEVRERSVVPPMKRELEIMNKEFGETAKTAEAGIKQETRDRRQETIPPEVPKTREAPQPAPVAQGSGVLREIRPTGIEMKPEASIKKQEVRATEQEARSKEQRVGDGTKAPQPPTGLPFIKEVEQLTKTPEIEAGIKKQEVRATAQQEITKMPQPLAKTPDGRYATDPYREPIE